jgi:hypothetical protein
MAAAWIFSNLEFGTRRRRWTMTVVVEPPGRLAARTFSGSLTTKLFLGYVGRFYCVVQ